MSLYPSLEDMKVDQMMKAQEYVVQQQIPQAQQVYTNSVMPIAGGVYPALGEYMGLELSEEMIRHNMPEYGQVTQQNSASAPYNMVAPVSGQSLGLYKAQVTNGIRELILCKDKDGKVGVRVKSIDTGIFVCLVVDKSPASLAGLRFGDQILQINGTTVAGFTMEQVHKLLGKCDINNIKVVVRDRPFERTLTLHKDSTGSIGFHFKNGRINNIIKESSAARNGVLIDHNLLEVDGQNVVGLKDKDVTRIISECGNVVTITVMPSFLYEHIIKKMSGSLIKNLMDHSIPNL